MTGVDARWIDDPGGAAEPDAAQNHGVDAVALPTMVYKLPIGAKPVRR